MPIRNVGEQTRGHNNTVYVTRYETE